MKAKLGGTGCLLSFLLLSLAIIPGRGQASDEKILPRVIVGGELERAASTKGQFSATCPGGAFSVEFVNEFVRDKTTGVVTITGRVVSMSFNGDLSGEAIMQVNNSVRGSEIRSADVSCSYTKKDAAFVLLRLKREGYESGVTVLIRNGEIVRLR
jgi:hypothetical protein